MDNYDYIVDRHRALTWGKLWDHVRETCDVHPKHNAFYAVDGNRRNLLFVLMLLGLS